jgi:hypothetical protein
MTTTTNTTTNTTTEVSFVALSRVSGKSVTALEKLKAHSDNGASVGALIGANICRKAAIDQLASAGMAHTARELAGGNIRPAAALVAAKSGRAVTLMELNGKAPYSEWLRMGAQLRSLPQEGKTGKPTTAAKALQLWEQLQESASIIRSAKFEKLE